MEILVVLLLFGGGGFVLASFTGGLASAIAAGGREDNSLGTNALIGFLGWLLACSIWSLATGSWPEEATFGLLVLTLVCSVVVARIRDHRQRARIH